MALIGAASLCAMPLFAQSGRNPGTPAAGGASTIQQAASGKELFRQHCAACHFAESTAQKIGPGLKGLYRRSFANGKKVGDASLTRWIEEGGKDMPGFQVAVKPEQVRALISYIKTL